MIKMQWSKNLRCDSASSGIPITTNINVKAASRAIIVSQHYCTIFYTVLCKLFLPSTCLQIKPVKNQKKPLPHGDVTHHVIASPAHL